MDEIQAKDLVKKLVQAAFNAGKYSAHPGGLMAKSETKKAIDLGDKIARYLTSLFSQPSNSCVHDNFIYLIDVQMCLDCGKHF